MIDLKAIMAVIGRSNLSVSDLDRHGRSVINEIQEVFCPYSLEKIDSPEVTNFDSFKFAWNRLPRSDRFRLITVAYREHRELFADVKLDSQVDWDNFTLVQQVQLRTATKFLLKAAVTLFSDEAFAADYRSGFVGAMRAVQNENDQRMLDVARGVA